MDAIFKLLVTRLIIKTEELFKVVKQKPMMGDNYLFSVVFIDFSKIKPKKSLTTKIYIQIMLLYVKGWLDEYFDEMEDGSHKNQCILLLLVWFYKYLVGTKPIFITNDFEFAQLLTDITDIISNSGIEENEKNIISQIGKSNAAFDKDKNDTDISLILILNEWMQFKVLK